jgi:hypothetical protein
VLLTRSPLTTTPKSNGPFDLHVLSTPPAFVLSQDQTLQQKPKEKQPHHPQAAERSQQTTTHTTKHVRVGTTNHTQPFNGTLLSSQRTDTHHREPLGPLRGYRRLSRATAPWNPMEPHREGWSAPQDSQVPHRPLPRLYQLRRPVTNRAPGVGHLAVSAAPRARRGCHLEPASVKSYSPMAGEFGRWPL